MTLDQLTELFKWMTIINVSLLILSSILGIVLKDLVGRMHGKLFGVQEDQVALVGYGYLGMYRVLVLVFNIVPYLSLLFIN